MHKKRINEFARGLLPLECSLLRVERSWSRTSGHWLEIRCARCKTPSDVDLAGDEASADHLRARSREPPALPEMRNRRRPCYNWPGNRAILGPQRMSAFDPGCVKTCVSRE